MKLLMAFWKLFKRKEKQSETEHRKVSGIGGKSVLESSDKSIDQKPKTPHVLKKKKETVHIQVGLDFGTSATKVAFSQLGRRTFRVINFNHRLPNYPTYCLPSIGCIGHDGRLLWA